ncbi:MAG TPA: hypothetical protein VKR06_25055 [Ktedonosporobacter sp.]|nr:hypothetical protein [Ktedonosporobacter sp.]
MSKRLPPSIWLVTLLIAVILGIVPGLALPQNALSTGIALLFGWLFLLASLPFAPGVDYVTHIPEWFAWLILLYYPFVLLMASVCAYWTMLLTGRKRQALLVVGLLAAATALVCIPVSLIAPSLNSNGTSFTVGLILPVWLGVVANLLVSAGLGWCIASLIPRSKHRTAS